MKTLLLIVVAFCLPTHTANALETNLDSTIGEINRSPVDLAISSDGRWIVTANETSDSISLIDASERKLIDEIAAGASPSAIAICPDDKTVLVSASHDGRVNVFKIAENKLARVATIDVRFEPRGIAVSPNGKRAFVALSANAQVAEIDVEKRTVVRTIDVKRWPRFLAITPDGKRLAVGCSGDERIVVVDTKLGEVLYERRLIGAVNFGQMQCSADGKYVYFPWMVYRQFPITNFNVTQGWVLASRIARVDMTASNPHEKFSLDPRGKAIADPHGIAISPDGTRLVAAASGTHELLTYRLKDLPFRDFGATTDHIDGRLLKDKDLFDRVPLGGRPMTVRFAPDGKTVLIANWLGNSVQVIDIKSKQIVDEISLGSIKDESLARRGAKIFFDGERSLNQWYSCHSCHYDGGSNSRPMDTMNDGSQFTLKTVLPLHNLEETGPWTWHGWQEDLDNAMTKSLTVTMLGNPPKSDDPKALLAYLNSIELPPNPHLNRDGSLTESAARGKKVFAKADCASCHTDEQFTDGDIHDVGTGSDKDEYDGYNTPSLRNVYRKVRFLHNGRARNLESLLTKYHSPEKVSGDENFTEKDLADLIEYLKSL